MKKTLLSLLSLLTLSSAYSQYEGFENWTQNSVLLLDDYQTSLNEGGAFLGNTIQSTDAYSGTYSLRLETVLAPLGDTAFGYMVSGDPDAFTPGQPTGLNNVDSIIGYYKYDVMPGDSITFLPVTFFAGTPTGPASGEPFYITGTQATWKRFAFYIGAPITDSLLFAVATGDPLNDFNGIPGTWIQIDDIQLKSSTGVTQNILNNSFENWTPLVWDELDGWKTSNQWYIGEPILPVVKTTDAYNGNYAVELNTFLDSRGDTAWAAITNGEFGQNQMEGGVPFSGNPIGIEFYYKYFPSGIDTAYFNIEFKKTGFASQWGGTWVADSASSYTLKSNSLPFLNSPDSVLITVNSGRIPGTQLIVDDLNFIFPVGVSEFVDVEKIVAYPNPVKEVLNIRFNLKADKNIKIRLVDIVGKELTSLDFGNLSIGTYNQTFNVSSYSSGVYFIEFVIDGEKKIERFIVE